MDTNPVKPLIKWAGGKRQIADELLSRFPKDWDQGTYIEPFMGGAAMFLHVAPRKSIVADVNSRLFGFYRNVKENPEPLYAGIVNLGKKFDTAPEELKKDIYLDFRTSFNASEVSSLDSATLLYVLNKLCFNGLYRENSKGGFNVPFGQKKSLQVVAKEDFDSVSRVLSITMILNSDFEETLVHAKAGDFVYLDPPYIPLESTPSFTSYHSVGFDINDQKRLAATMIKLKTNGVRAMCSNSDTSVTREVFSKLTIDAIQAPRMVSAKASGRGSVSELVITNYK